MGDPQLRPRVLLRDVQSLGAGLRGHEPAGGRGLPAGRVSELGLNLAVAEIWIRRTRGRVDLSPGRPFTAWP